MDNLKERTHGKNCELNQGFNYVCQSWSLWEAKPEESGWAGQGIREAGNQMKAWVSRAEGNPVPAVQTRGHSHTRLLPQHFPHLHTVLGEAPGSLEVARTSQRAEVGGARG